ncbi:hypothetical protein NE237_021419 [Protea cynaroides]|uniref:Uncharacterized protein n=1 Tax=Protea cynaroides TaxID=273540 RepID=A0A9Q0HD99_9MAGN|nr:hypothetical protein NE237_021419 [Protea cynaroides]
MLYRKLRWVLEQVAGGLPDLNALFDPVVSGGITRVVLPQDVRNRQAAECASQKGDRDKKRQPRNYEGVKSTEGRNKDVHVGSSNRHLGLWADAKDDDVSEAREEGNLMDLNVGIPLNLNVDMREGVVEDVGLGALDPSNVADGLNHGNGGSRVGEQDSQGLLAEHTGGDGDSLV